MRDAAEAGYGGSEAVEPRQARSRRSYHRLLEAATELLAGRAFEDITVDEIAERAGYTKGAFYARFESKGALLRHLVGRLTDGGLEAWGEFLDPGRWDGVSSSGVVESFIRRMVVVHARAAPVMRAADREVRPGGDAAVRTMVRRLDEGVRSGFVRLMESRSGELAPAVQADVAGECAYWLTALASVLRGVFLRPDGRAVDSVEAEAERAIRLLAPYLVGSR